MLAALRGAGLTEVKRTTQLGLFSEYSAVKAPGVRPAQCPILHIQPQFHPGRNGTTVGRPVLFFGVGC
ncbi:MAG: hypothetical protein WDM96_07885 [Lacunisphaera sp.]